jgi:predicted metal-dependent HD superfamily phosphohydrolase
LAHFAAKLGATRLVAGNVVTLMSAHYRCLLADLFEHVPLPEADLVALRRRMRAPGRHYHNLAHLAEMWRQHRTMARGALRTRRLQRLIASTIALHDAVYRANRPDNEAASAALWRRLAGQWRRLPRELVRQVASAIEATANHADPHAGAACEPWVKWVLDLDLSPIGSSSHRVRANGSRLRAELRNLSAAAWQERSRRFYDALQQRDHIFHSPRLRSAFESNARRYLRGTLDSLP